MLSFCVRFLIKYGHEPNSISSPQLSFFLFSREESRPHVHITCPEGQAKFWLEPIVSLAHFHGIQARVLKQLQLIVEVKPWA